MERWSRPKALRRRVVAFMGDAPGDRDEMRWGGVGCGVVGGRLEEEKNERQQVVAALGMAISF
jgi:hypothetical protein